MELRWQRALAASSMDHLFVGNSNAWSTAGCLVVIIHTEASLDHHVAVEVLVSAVLICNDKKKKGTTLIRAEQAGFPWNLDKVGWPIWGMQGSGLQLSLAAGFSRSSQPSLDCTSWSERQRTSLTRKPPSHVFEHWRDMNQEQQSASHLQKSGLSLISFWHLSKLILVDFTVVCEKYDKISFPNHA